MTSLIEKIVDIIAPHRCISCSKYNNIVCAECLSDLLLYRDPFCLTCGRPTQQWRICAGCAPEQALVRAYAVAEYSGVVKSALHKFKFEHARAAAYPLAHLLDVALPIFDGDWIVVPVPTASARIRQRSYDHVVLLARQFARMRGLCTKQLLGRRASVRQVGASRQERKSQVAGLYYTRGNDIAGAKILLIDDVCTTGATLDAAASALMVAGAGEVIVAAVAWQPLKP